MTHVDALNGQVNVVEEFVVVLDGHAGGEEDHDLLLAILLQEGEEQQKSLLRRAHDVTLKTQNNFIVTSNYEKFEPSQHMSKIFHSVLSNCLMILFIRSPLS